MKAYLRYLKSLLRHKYFVAVAGIKVGRIPYHRLIFHDWTKFLPSEFIPYAKNFYGTKTEQTAIDFDYGWLAHQNRNPHHWQYWILVYDDDPKKDKPLRMPETYVREMVADWAGAGRAYNGKWDVVEWYNKHKDNIIIHPDTRGLVERLLITYYDD